jgi:hypothetical protein
MIEMIAFIYSDFLVFYQLQETYQFVLVQFVLQHRVIYLSVLRLRRLYGL